MRELYFRITEPQLIEKIDLLRESGENLHAIFTQALYEYELEEDTEIVA